MPTYKRPALSFAAAALLTGQAHAAHLSELFQSGPAGQAIELTGVDDTVGATLAILNGTRFDANGFGQVLELIHLPANSGWSPVVLISDNPWPDASVTSTPLADLGPASGASTLALGGAGFDRLLVVFDGETDLALGDNPVNDADDALRYDASAVTDWLALGPTGLSDGYTSAGYDIADINTALGIDLLARTADRGAGQVIARTHLPGQLLDLDDAWVGDPDANGLFPVGGGLVYETTPGLANLGLFVVPEPGSAAGVALGGLALLARRRRTARCSGVLRGL